MKCMHCRVAFHDNGKHTYVDEDADGIWWVQSYQCPACDRLNVFLECGVNTEPRNRRDHASRDDGVISREQVYPSAAQSRRSPCPPEVPSFIAEDYIEACIVVANSPKASAALSRRCLQSLLREAASVKPGNLDKEIQQAIDSRTLPSSIVEMIDAVRNIGNFAAHPLKSTSTGEILPVEPHEAEWNLDVLEELFDFYYVRPTVIAKKRDALNQKLKDAGKPPMK